MTGHRPFGELTKNFTPARRARVAAKAAALREEMTLEELRKARSLSQEEVAASLDGRPACRGKARKAHGHAREQPAPLHRGTRRHARNHRALRGYSCGDQRHRGCAIVTRDASVRRAKSADPRAYPEALFTAQHALLLRPTG